MARRRRVQARPAVPVSRSRAARPISPPTSRPVKARLPTRLEAGAVAAVGGVEITPVAGSPSLAAAARAEAERLTLVRQAVLEEALMAVQVVGPLVQSVVPDSTHPGGVFRHGAPLVAQFGPGGGGGGAQLAPVHGGAGSWMPSAHPVWAGLDWPMPWLRSHS